MSGTNVMLFRSTDTGAPTLSGTVGSLIAVLDACLKDGYQSKTVTIARSGSTATATCATAHGYQADGLTKINISGAAQSEYNGDFSITNVTTLTFDFTITGTPDSPATGTITAKVAPLGWGKPYAGTNKGVYRSAETTATRLYLRVDDNNPTADSAKTARVIGYEAMTDMDTGTGLFTQAGGLWINKSDTSSTAARPWVLVGDGFEFHFFYVNNIVSYPDIYRQFHFGDPSSEMASDPYGCLIYGDSASALAAPQVNSETWAVATSNSIYGQSAHNFARAYTQIGGAVMACKHGNYDIGGNAIGATGLVSYPAPHNNGLYIAPIFVSDNVVLRAQLKALYQPLHVRPLGNAVVVPANVSPINRRLFSIATAYSNTLAGETHIDIDGPWR